MKENELAGMREVQKGYTEALYNLSTSGRYDDRDDFTVVLQPHLAGFKIPTLVILAHCIIIVYFFSYN